MYLVLISPFHFRVRSRRFTENLMKAAGDFLSPKRLTRAMARFGLFLISHVVLPPLQRIVQGDISPPSITIGGLEWAGIAKAFRK